MTERMLSQEEIDAMVKSEPKEEKETKLQDLLTSDKVNQLFDYLEAKIGEKISLLTGEKAQTKKQEIYVEHAGRFKDGRLVISLCSTDNEKDILIYMEEVVAKALLSHISASPKENNMWTKQNMDALGQVFDAVADEFSKAISEATKKHFSLAVALPEGPSGLQEFLDEKEEYLVLDYALDWKGSEVGKLGFIADGSEMLNLLAMKDEEGSEEVPSIDSLIESMEDDELDEELISHFTEGYETEEDLDDVVVKPVQFPPLSGASGVGASVKDSNLDIILDLPVRLTVELGRTHRTLKDILNLRPGSVIELERLAGEPVDILANGVFIAKGEVVVIDETFGVKITEIATKEQRINRIK